MLRLYNRALARRPLVTQSVGSAALFAAGDVIAQQAIEHRTRYGHDAPRTARMALYGGVVFGPAATTWYKLLEHVVRIPSSTALTLAARVTADQVLFAPLNLSAFLASMSILEGSSPVSKVRENFKRGYLANLALWPAVQGVNFTLVPLQHRVLVVNVISLGWNCVLSMINQGKAKPD